MLDRTNLLAEFGRRWQYLLAGGLTTITLMLIASMSTPATAVGEAVEETIADLEAFIPHRMEETGVTGLAIAVVDGNEIVWEEGFGEANSWTGSRVTSASVFEVASISKPVAAYAALALVAEGALDLDRPVAGYLPEPWVTDQAGYETMTIRHLLTHTSGLTNNLNPLDRTISFPPGSRYQYSGVGFSLLQEVLEEVSGKPLDELAAELVFEPLGMSSSAFENTETVVTDLVNGHIRYSSALVALVAVFALGFGIAILLITIVHRLRSGKFGLPAGAPLLSWLIGAAAAEGVVVFIVGGVNKWFALSMLWIAGLSCFTGLVVALVRRRNPGDARLRRRQTIAGAVAAMIFIAATGAVSGPVPRQPAGPTGAAHSLRATAGDLARFLIELSDPQHLDPRLVGAMKSRQISVSESGWWGLGIGITRTARGDALWHGGDNLDFHAFMTIIPSTGDGAVVVTNQQDGDLIVRDIAGRALGLTDAWDPQTHSRGSSQISGTPPKTAKAAMAIALVRPTLSPTAP